MRDTALPETSAATSKSPAGEQVYEELLTRILSGHLGPGDRITIDAVGRDLGVSQTPVREALHRLDADGLVVRAHLAGYRVAPRLTRERFEDLVEIRLALEPAAAARLARVATRADIEELTAAAAATHQLLNTKDSRAYALFSQRDAALHNLIATLSGNTFLRDSIARLHTHAHLFRLSSQGDITERAIDEHNAIIAGIAAQSPDTASTAMRVHVERSAERFRRAFDARPQPIDDQEP